MNFINQLFEYWINTHWAIAILMSILANLIIYIIVASAVSFFTQYVVESKGVGRYIDTRNYKANQKSKEIKNGVFACVILGFCSILTRLNFHGVWPESIMLLFFQVAVFAIFYDAYSYFVHRLLHNKYLIKFHSVHHASVRVTPWSAYSVHPLEAVAIGVSAPIFMCIFPLSLGVAFTLHIFGMILTILLHSNYEYISNIKALNMVFSYLSYHSKHHFFGNVNYGFINGFWDVVLKTTVVSK